MVGVLGYRAVLVALLLVKDSQIFIFSVRIGFGVLWVVRVNLSR